MFDQRLGHFAAAFTSGHCFLLVYLMIQQPLQVPAAAQQHTEPFLCKMRCICIDGVVDCNQLDHQVAIPTNIPVNYTRLFLQHTNFLLPVLGWHNFTGIEHLEHIKIIYTNLQRIEPRAFVRMHRLREMDLSNNNLRTIEPYTFYSLKLSILYLELNSRLRLYPLSFAGLKVKSLSLKSVNLPQLEFGTISHLELKQLYLFNNSLRVLDPQFASFIQQPDHLIDVTGNPLRCSCSLQWLWQHLRYRRRKSHLQRERPRKEDDDSQDFNVTCLDVDQRQHRLETMSVEELHCSTAQVTGILVNLLKASEGWVEVSCLSQGNPRPRMKIDVSPDAGSSLQQQQQQLLPALSDSIEEVITVGGGPSDALYQVQTRVNLTLPWISPLSSGEKMEENEEERRGNLQTVSLWCTSDNNMKSPPHRLNFSLLLPRRSPLPMKVIPTLPILPNEHRNVAYYPLDASRSVSSDGATVAYQFGTVQLVMAVVGTLLATVVVAILFHTFLRRRSLITAARHKGMHSGLTEVSANDCWSQQHQGFLIGGGVDGKHSSSGGAPGSGGNRRIRSNGTHTAATVSAASAAANNNNNHKRGGYIAGYSAFSMISSPHPHHAQHHASSSDGTSLGGGPVYDVPITNDVTNNTSPSQFVISGHAYNTNSTEMPSLRATEDGMIMKGLDSVQQYNNFHSAYNNIA